MRSLLLDVLCSLRLHNEYLQWIRSCGAESLPGLEIDELVNCGLLPHEDRFDDKVLKTLHLCYPEAMLNIMTGDKYTAEQLSIEVENLILPSLVFDSLWTELHTYSELLQQMLNLTIPVME